LSWCDAPAWPHCTHRASTDGLATAPVGACAMSRSLLRYCTLVTLCARIAPSSLRVPRVPRQIVKEAVE
jgi:hypothetical protein